MIDSTAGGQQRPEDGVATPTGDRLWRCSPLRERRVDVDAGPVHHIERDRGREAER
jgi:hypothetical protein